ncbi:hypothetical protein [Bradyrhizobium sp. I1.7.5]|uniref:hypothetical protein n=1 Tax=Bradyrhizobium sp. I1.7.5 TaxID=3156363 RepID=UPI00339431C1
MGFVVRRSLTIPADYAGTSLALSGYLQLHFLNSDARDAFWVVSYSFQYTFSIAAALFTASANSVNFNNLTQAQIDAIGSAPLAIYDALAGDDSVTLPNSNTIPGVNGVTWNLSIARCAHRVRRWQLDGYD